jgi:glycosyltransferase involved in cell wall biosynthesis
MPGITATIITFNEESRIAEAIASLACCDEVLVVDSGSTDNTREIARALGARVIERDWPGYARQKNFAADQAVNDWILSVDADERLSMELADEITRWRRDRETAIPIAVAWSMSRRAFYLGRWIRHSGWYPDWKIRLYDRRHCRWEGYFVHEWVKVNGKTGRLRGDLLHFPYRDWHDHNRRIEKYTTLAAAAARSDGRRGNVLKLIFAPPLTFLKTFLVRAGFLDGWRGLAIAYMGARYVFQREFRILR